MERNITYRLWKYLNKKIYVSSFIYKLHKHLSKKLQKKGVISSFIPLKQKKHLIYDIYLLSEKNYQNIQTIKNFIISNNSLLQENCKIAQTVEGQILISYKKFFSLQLFKDTLETLIVGSSHGFLGFLAEENRHEINACEISQDLYYSYEIYKKYSDAPRLKNIVIFYSVFSPGTLLELAQDEEWRCDPYYYFYNIPYRFRGNTEKDGVEEAFSLFISQIKNQMDFHYVGNAYPSFAVFNITDPKERSEKHLKANTRDENQTVYIEKAVKLAKEKGHNVYVVIPPARSDYTKFLPSFEQLFAELLKLKDYIKIISFFRDERFLDSDFGDTDHLNEQGAKKLSTFIRDSMKLSDKK